MPRLTPNAPRKRLQWVIDRYGKGDNRDVKLVFDTFMASVYLFGMEAVQVGERVIVSAIQTEESSWLDTRRQDVFDLMRLEKSGPRVTDLSDDEADWLSQPAYKHDKKQYAAALLEITAKHIDAVRRRLLGDDERVLHRLQNYLADFPEHHANDFLVPWIAKQLFDLRVAEMRGHVRADDYTDASDALDRKGTAIATWARETRQNLGRVTLADALNAVRTYEFTATGKPPERGEVVYRFKDGYTIHELTTREQLAAEGVAMQNCVGSYAGQVNAGTSHIYSLRDSRGHPHVTMEWRAERDSFVRYGTYVGHGHFAQILGKQNDPPVPKYLPYVQEFIRESFGADPVSMLEAGASGDGMNLHDTDLRGRNLTGRSFRNADLRGVDFRGADLDDADFAGADASGANFSQAHLDATDWEGTRISNADFLGAHWGRPGAIGDHYGWAGSSPLAKAVGVSTAVSVEDWVMDAYTQEQASWDEAGE